MKFILSITAALAIGVALAAQPSPGAAPADLLVLNGKVYTAGKNATFAQAVAVRGNKIAAVGTAQEIEKLRGPSTQVVDAGGGAVLPGFNDVHTHMLSGGLAMDTVDLGGAGTLEEVQQRIRTSRRRTPIGSGFRDATGTTSRFPAASRPARSSTPWLPIARR